MKYLPWNLNIGKRSFLGWIRVNQDRFCVAWLLVAALLSLVRALGSPASPLLYAVLLFAVLSLPVPAFRWGISLFPSGSLPAQSLSSVGARKWSRLDPLEWHQLRRFDNDMIFSMMVCGLLLNIPVRALEFVAAMPFPIVNAPGWYLALFPLMLLDLAVLTTCYAALSGIALSGTPAFPRLLIAVWLLDISAQLGIAAATAYIPGLPEKVMLLLIDLLHGNINKVAISVAIWLPYLLFSQRINLTFRGRLALKPIRR